MCLAVILGIVMMPFSSFFLHTRNETTGTGTCVEGDALGRLRHNGNVGNWLI